MRSATVLLFVAASMLVAVAGTASARILGENLSFRSPIAAATEHLVARGLHTQFAIPQAAADARLLAGDVSFQHGVASGDPYSDSVILWTRVTPADADDKVTGSVAADAEAVPAAVVQVSYKVALDAALTQVVDAGVVPTNVDVDYTVKVEAAGLNASTFYYYQFAVGNVQSPVGRTKTIPKEDADVESLRFAVVSCSNYPWGFFNAYGRIASKNLDVVLHLGDYIYEYGAGESGDASTGRVVLPSNPTVTLSDYRIRHALYKTDIDSQLVHGAHPFIAVWDDHEVADNSWKDGAKNHNPSTQGPFSVRKANGIRAYYEWMPLRQIEVDNRDRIYRSFKMGRLVDLIMLDTRLYGRDQTDISTPSVINDPNRTMLGFEQEKWFYDQLSASSARGAQWRLIGNQVLFAQLRNPVNPNGAGLDVDAWDGYLQNRLRVLNHISNNNISNVVFVTGDIHTSFAFDISIDPFDSKVYTKSTGKGSLAVEFVTPAVTSLGLLGDNSIENAIVRNAYMQVSPHLKYLDGGRGYMIVTMNKQRTACEWYGVTIKNRNSDEKFAKTLQTLSGANHLTSA